MDYFAANDISAFTTVAGSPTEVTTGGRYDSGNTSKAISVGGGGSGVLKSARFINSDTGASASLTDAWFHFDIYHGSGNAGSGTFVEVLNSSGTAVIRIFSSSNATTRIDYWNGSAWVTTGTTFTASLNTLHTYDLHLVAGASGSYALTFDNVASVSLSGLNAAVDNFAFLQLKDGGLSEDPMSQFLVSDANTVGAEVKSLVPNANSATNTAWANDYTNLVKTGYNDATVVSSSTASDKESYGAVDVTLPGGYSISSTWAAFRAKLNSSSPANLKFLMRIGGTDYSGAYNVPNLSSAAFGAGIAAFSLDPSTAAAWGLTNANAAELGFITTT